MTGYNGEEMLLTDEQRKRGVGTIRTLWKENGIMHIPYQIDSSSKYFSIRSSN